METARQRRTIVEENDITYSRAAFKIGNRVGAIPCVENEKVVTAAANERVIARAAVELIVPVTAVECVPAPTGILQDIVSVTAEQPVVAIAAVERVPPDFAEKRVVAFATQQFIAKDEPEEPPLLTL